MRTSAVFTIVLAVACGGGTAEWSGTVEELPGGGRWVRNPAGGVWDGRGGDGWRLEEELRIGEVEGDGPTVFGSVSGVFVDPWDRLHVIEGQAHEIRVFGADGTPARVIGREGEGPGEFRGPNGIVWDAAGTMWVADGLQGRRYTRFDTAGTVLETHVGESRALGFGGFAGGLTPDGVLYDTDLLVPEGAGANPLFAAAGLGGGRMILRAMLDVAGEPVTDTVPLPAPRTEPVTFSTTGLTMSAPFNPRMHWRFDPRGHVWFGESDAYRIHQRSFAGDTVRIVEREYSPLPVRQEDIDEWLESRMATRFREAGGRLDVGRIPKVKPVFDNIIIDDAGHLWVRLVTHDDAVVFDVFDPEGRYLGAVEGGAEMATITPVIHGDRFYGVVRDSLDIPYVVRYRILGREIAP